MAPQNRFRIRIPVHKLFDDRILPHLWHQRSQSSNSSTASLSYLSRFGIFVGSIQEISQEFKALCDLLKWRWVIQMRSSTFPPCLFFFFFCLTCLPHRWDAMDSNRAKAAIRRFSTGCLTMFIKFLIPFPFSLPTTKNINTDDELVSQLHQGVITWYGLIYR
jgi:hypothetical protein